MEDSRQALWLQCLCHGPSVIIIDTYYRRIVEQAPAPAHFKTGENWPPYIEKLFDEAVHSYGAGVYTTSTMACRKMLMHCACDKGAEDGKTFAYYVDYITNEVLKFPNAKDSIDEIRNIGNDANHKISFVEQDDAKKALKILVYLLNATYSFPASKTPSNNKSQRTR